MTLTRRMTPAGGGILLSSTGVLTVKKGNVHFAVRVAGLPVDKAKAAEQTLARQIVTKL